MFHLSRGYVCNVVKLKMKYTLLWNVTIILKLYDCAEKINAKFKHFSKDDQFLFLMQTEELSKEVAKYCYKSFEKRNSLLVA